MDPRLPENRLRWGIGVGVAALAVILIVLLGGELTREELIAEGDEICAEAHEAFRDLQRDQPTTARAAEDLTDELIAIAEDERDEIDDLDGPDDLDEEVDRYVEARERGIELMRRGRAAADDGSQTAYEQAQTRLDATQADRRRIARKIGFSVCSERIELEGA